MRLVRPSTKYSASFLEALEETIKNDASNLQMMVKSTDPEDIKNDFAAFTKKLRSMAKGENLPKGYVPGSIFWLIDNKTFIGQISIRHSLTEKLKKVGGHIGYFIRPSYRKKGYGTAALKLAILKAQELGIERILVTCDITNIGSRKIIEKNYGVLQDTIFISKDKPKKMRFWITPN